MAFEKTLMFGKSQENIGSTDAHACINTAGDVYVRTKNRYVCIFKGGRLNVDGSSEIFSVDSVDSIKKTGIYLVSGVNEAGEAVQSAYLCIDGVKLLLASGSEQYVSFSAVQNLSAENFLQAAKNMGLYFDTLDAAKASGIQSGLVYILSEQRLYKVINGEFSELIQVAGGGANGSTGEEEEEEPEPEELESLQIGNIFIDGTEGIINAEGGLIIQVNGSDYFKLKGNVIYPLKDIQLDWNREMFFQGSRKGQSGFSLWYENGEAYLDVDHLTTRDPSDTYIPQMYTPYIGTAVAGYINSAIWKTAPSEIQLSFLSDIDLKVGDIVLLYIGSKNRVEVEVRNPTGNEYEVNVWAENPVSTDTVIKVTGGDFEPYFTVNVTIPADSNAGGATTANDIAPVKRIDIVSGDSDLYFVNQEGEMSGGGQGGEATQGRVTSVGPVVVQLDTPTSGSDNILSALKYTPIYRLVQSGKTDTIIWHEAENISLLESTANGNHVDKKIISKIGDLSEITSPIGTALEKWGIYSDNFWAVKAHLFAGTFEGNSEEWYPKYGTSLPIPSKDGSDSGAYDLVVPPIQWIKLIIEKKIDEALEKVKEWIDDAKDELRAYTDSKVSQMESSILSEVDSRIAAAIAALGTS